MNWNAVSFDWNQLRAFLAAAEEGSFSAAARALNTTQPVADHIFIGAPDPIHLITSMHNRGIPLRPENFAIQPDSSMVTWEMVKSGHGFSLLPEVLGESEPIIEKVFPDLSSLQFPIWLVTHKELQTSPRIRTVFDFLTNQLGKVAKNHS